MTTQQVNLLSAELIPPRVWLSARELMIGIGIFTTLLLAYSALQALNLPALKDIEQAAQAQLKKMNTTVAGEPPAQIAARISELKAEQARQRSLLETLQDVPQHSFSAYLKGLSESRVEGLWLEKIQLERERKATRIGLSGRSLATPQVPALLDALGSDEVFSGYQFTDLEVKKTDGYVQFSLLTQAEEAS